MNRTKIEWVRNPDGSQGYTWNPIKGMCPYACSYCYARRMYKRFKWNPNLRIDTKELYCKIPQKPSRIFVGSMIDLFHPRIGSDRINEIVGRCRVYKEHTFIFLTKNPSRYQEFEFPQNCWLGTTVTGKEDCNRSNILCQLPNENLKFISIEPLLSQICICVRNVSWLIIGGLTPKSVHKNEWIRQMRVDAITLRDDKTIPVFIKSNANYPIKIQEFPK